MVNTDTAWKKWGEIDPYFGVLAHDKFRHGNLADSRDEFFETGVQYLADRLAVIEDHLGSIPRDRALDFGCGVGRITIPLASEFGEAVGVDISPGMVQEAQRNAAMNNTANIDFVLSDNTLSRVQGEFDFVHSYIVIQHIPVDRGMPIIGMLLDRVRSGGVASIHVSLGRDSLIGSALYWTKKNIPGAHEVAKLLKGNSPREPMMQMNSYSLPALLELFSEKGFVTIMLNRERHDKEPTVHLAAKRS